MHPSLELKRRKTDAVIASLDLAFSLKSMKRIQTIGVLGGMGPEATNRLCELITANTRVAKDQDHIPVVAYNNSRIPNRVEGVEGAGESPLPEMIRTARVLEDAGADVLLMPCNLAHFYLNELREAVRVPFLNMIEEAVKFTVETYAQERAAGLLASTPTVRSGLYEKEFQRCGWSVAVPDEDSQKRKVMEAIYGERGIKRGHKSEPARLLKSAASGLVERGARVIVAGCTEVSLVLAPDENYAYAVVDPLEILARAAIAVAGGALLTQTATPQASGAGR